MIGDRNVRAVKKMKSENRKMAPGTNLFLTGMLALVDGVRGPLGKVELHKAWKFGKTFGVKLLSS